ncbi:MAG: hypothetical protein KF803_02720 [Cyclobacteriaceae bacterium]|nr:hypothetical protein [Cyclobacteriaceae bacterium]
MKSKILLPLLAVLFAVAGALATPMLVQSGWYDSNGPGVPGGGMEGSITTPSGDTPVCGSLGQQVCKIGFFDAYNSQEAAENADENGLLRYTPN